MNGLNRRNMASIIYEKNERVKLDLNSLCVFRGFQDEINTARKVTLVPTLFSNVHANFIAQSWF